MVLDSLPVRSKKNALTQEAFIKQVFGKRGISSKQLAEAERYIKLMAGDVVGAAVTARKLKIVDAVIARKIKYTDAVIT